jgi:hypothetical protein
VLLNCKVPRYESGVEYLNGGPESRKGRQKGNLISNERLRYGYDPAGLGFESDSAGRIQ